MRLFILPILLSFMISIGPSHAQTDRKTIESVVFSTLEKRLIREILGTSGAKEEAASRPQSSNKKNNKGKGNKGGKNKGGLPPGLAKKNGLPPGLAKRQTLPPGLQKRALPASLEHQLPERRHTERLIIDDDVILIERGTNLVLDILEDVIKDAI